jgi:hypothetical protein
VDVHAGPAHEQGIYALVLLAAANSFLGLVSSTGKANIFAKGADSADKLLTMYAVKWNQAGEAQRIKGTYSRWDMDLIALGVLLWAANLAGWGQADGQIQFLSKWPQIRTLCELATDLGSSERLYYMPTALMAAGYYKIPSLLGGNKAKATAFLQEAATKTNIPEAKCSSNGFVNLYYSQVLNDKGDTDHAKGLAQNFINADPKLFPYEIRPENEEYRLQTINILKTF